MAGADIGAAFYAMPTAYNGRASSVIISGTPVRRPRGIVKIPGTSEFEYAPSRRMDYELEMGFFVSKPVDFDHNISTVDEAKEHIFGFVLLNDWSARDIQFTEMTPLGPFNGKGSGTSISPWIITLDALEEAVIETADQIAVEKMQALPRHLAHSDNAHTWNIELEASIIRSGETHSISQSNLKDLYWSPAQMLSHHASSGCGLRTGDLMGTGTISSPGNGENASLGCLHELTRAGTQRHPLAPGKTTGFLEDGDEVVFSGWALAKDGRKFGFGTCRGVLLPSRQ
jgi:fumarylacetoacetase